MDLKQLRYFTAIIDEGGVRRASEQVHISQPAITVAIKNLEADLGVKLFIRKGRNLQATKEGYHFYKHACSILAQADKAKADMASLTSLQMAHIKIAAPTMIAGYVLADSISDFMSLHPGIRITANQMGGPRVETALLRGDIDIGFMGNKPEAAHIEANKVAEAEIYAFVRPEHPLSLHSYLTWPDVLKYELVTLARSYLLYENIKRQASRHRATADIILESDIFPLLTTSIRKSDSVGLFLGNIAAHEPNLVCIPIRPKANAPAPSEVKIAINACYLNNAPLSLAAKAFLAHMQQSLR